MNREDIINLAQKAGVYSGANETVFAASLERFAALVAKHTLANIDPKKFMSWQEGFEAGRTQQNKELVALREFAGGRCAIQSVIGALGPMSLWSKDAFERELEKARAEEREKCAKVCEEHPDGLNMMGGAFVTCAAAIRARGSKAD